MYVYLYKISYKLLTIFQLHVYDVITTLVKKGYLIINTNPSFNFKPKACLFYLSNLPKKIHVFFINTGFFQIIHLASNNS